MTQHSSSLYHKIRAIVTVLCISVAGYGWTFWLFQHRFAQGQLLSVSDAAIHLPQIILQNVLTILPVVLMMVGALVVWRGQFAEKLFLRIPKRSGRITTLVFAAIYLIELIAALIVRADRTTVLYQWGYYLLFIALTEELEFRALMPALLTPHVSAWCARLLPAALFALGHTLVPLATGAPLVQTLLKFISSQTLGYMVFSLLLDVEKQQTGTLWGAVLLHAAMDFSGVFAA